MIDCFLLSLATFNGLGFTFVIWASSTGQNSWFWQQYINNYDNSAAIIYLISSFLLGLASCFGWYLFKMIFRPHRSIKNIEYSEEVMLRYSKKIQRVAWLLLLLSIILYGLYSRAYGGYIGLLSHSIAIRSGISVINNPFSFLQRFGSLSFVSSYIFFSLLIDKSNAKQSGKRGNFIGCLCSLGFSLYVLFSWAGRVGALVYVFTFILGYVLYNFHANFYTVSKTIRRSLYAAVALPTFLIGLDTILGRSNRQLGITEFFAKELSFPFASFLLQLNQSNFRFFKDVFVSPLFLLPQRIWFSKLNIEVASSFNTFIFFGAQKGEFGVTGSIPVDMLTFSYMQASILGVVVIGLLWGGLLCYLDGVCRRVPVKGLRAVMYSNLVLNVAALSVLYGDPQHIIIRNFAMILGFIAINIVGKLKVK